MLGVEALSWVRVQGANLWELAPESLQEAFPGLASDGLVTRAVAGYNYSANWVICAESG